MATHVLELLNDAIDKLIGMRDREGREITHIDASSAFLDYPDSVEDDIFVRADLDQDGFLDAVFASRGADGQRALPTRRATSSPNQATNDEAAQESVPPVESRIAASNQNRSLAGNLGCPNTSDDVQP